MIKKIVSICLLLLVTQLCYCQLNNTGDYGVGFTCFEAVDETRDYYTAHDTVKRPMLIHFWYPSQKESGLKNMSFKDYIDLIAIREDFKKEQQAIDNTSENFINAYLGFSKREFGIDTSITSQEVLRSPVRAVYDARPIHDQFPLIIYAPSNSKSAVQNHILCEHLAASGYFVVSVGSAGYKTLRRNDRIKAVLAQVDDMEFIVKHLSDSLSLNYSDIGLLGFSSGSVATIMYQMLTPGVKAIVSLDGSHEYSYYLNLNKMDGFDYGKANTPYLMLSNKHTDFSVFPFYNSILSQDKYLYKMTSLDHNGFISYWQQFAMCGDDGEANSITDSYTTLCKCATDFFNATLKSENENPIGFQMPFNELIQKDSTDYGVVVKLLNQILQEGINPSIIEAKSNVSLYKGKADLLNIVGRMFIGYDDDMAAKIFIANTEIHPDSWESFYNLAYSYKVSNHIDSAKVAIAKARDINNDNKDIQSLYDEIMKMKEE